MSSSHVTSLATDNLRHWSFGVHVFVIGDGVASSFSHAGGSQPVKAKLTVLLPNTSDINHYAQATIHLETSKGAQITVSNGIKATLIGIRCSSMINVQQ